MLDFKKLACSLEHYLYCNFTQTCDDFMKTCVVKKSASGPMLGMPEGQALPACIPAFGAVVFTPHADAHMLCSHKGVDLYVMQIGKTWASELASPFHIVLSQTVKKYPNMVLASVEHTVTIGGKFEIMDRRV